MKLASVSDALIYAAAVLLLEPFYVAAGFGLYLNRRTLLEGWDIEVALRRIAERHAAALLSFFSQAWSSSWPCFSGPALAQQKNPKAEIAEVLKAPEFGHYRDATRWERARRRRSRPIRRRPICSWLACHRLRARQGGRGGCCGWRRPRRSATRCGGSRACCRAGREPPREAVPPPPALFGMELAPETLPADVAAAAARARARRQAARGAGLLYRGALSELVHKRGVQLLASHTEGEAVRLARIAYFAALVDAWRRCAYARRLPPADEVERFAKRLQGGLRMRTWLLALRGCSRSWPRGVAWFLVDVTSASSREWVGPSGEARLRRVSRRRALRHAHGPATRELRSLPELDTLKAQACCSLPNRRQALDPRRLREIVLRGSRPAAT